MPLIIEMGIGWKPDPEKPGGLTSCTDSDYVAEIERLRDECVSLRLTIEGQQEQAMVAKKVIESLRAVRSRKHGAV